jgi:cytochrome c peroxidase
MKTVVLAAALALLGGYQGEARKADPAFTASASRGEAFFNARHGNEWSCASCHGNPPTGQGKHATTGKAIAPLAPAANAERFADAAKVEKWFRRNCNDVLGRACTPAEKADVMAFVLQ